MLDEGRSLRQHLEILERRKWLALAVCLTVLVFGVIQVFTTTPLYRATATLQIDPEFSNIMPYEDIGEAGSRMPSEAYLLTQVTKLKSRSLAERTVLRLELADSESFNQPVRRGFFRDLLSRTKRGIGATFSRSATTKPSASENAPPHAVSMRLIKRLQRNLQVHPVRTTRLINVTYSSPDPGLSAQIVNGISAEFVRQNLESKYDSVNKIMEFLERELTGLGSKIETSEAASQEFARLQNLTLNQRQELNHGKLSDLIDSMTQIETELVRQRARYRAARGAKLSNFPAILIDASIRDLEGQITATRGRLAALAERYGPAWPSVKELRFELATVREQVAAAKRQVIDRTIQEYQVVLKRHQEFSSAVDRQRRIVDETSHDLVQFNMLEREVETNKELYDRVLQRLKEAGIAAGLKSNDIRVVETAVRPSSVHSPNKSHSLTLTLVIGLCLGVAGAFVVELMDRSLKTTDDVTQRLRLPALGVIPNLATDQGRKTWPRSKREPPKASLLTLPIDNRTPVQSQAWEAYRSFRTSVLLSHSGRPPQTILLASALPSEGKTTTAVNTAIALAQTGARTLILELDLRRPSLAQAFHYRGDEGMSRYLAGHCDLSSHVLQTRYPQLFMLPGGPLAPNPTELIGSERMATGLNRLREYFDYIVIDVPPSLHFTDALVLSPQVDGVIVVVRGGKTPCDLVRKVSDLFLTVGAKVLGVLINDSKVDSSSYGYYYRYYRDAVPHGHGKEAESSLAPWWGSRRQGHAMSRHEPQQVHPSEDRG